MQKISREKFEALIEGAKVLERQEGGLSALRTQDHRIIKIWQRRAGLTSDRIRPYSERFRINCEELNRRGVTAPVISESYVLQDTGEHVLCYQEIPGTPLRELAESSRLPLKDMAEFYAELHAKGVHFRSIHLGNVLRLDPAGFALIDVTDTSFTKKPLSLKRRAENLGYAWAYRTDFAYFDTAIRKSLLSDYLKASGLSPSDAALFNKLHNKAFAHYQQRRKARMGH